MRRHVRDGDSAGIRTTQRVKVQRWRSFSSNNSSSYYLVARFDDVARAQLCKRELRTYIETNDAELQAMSPRERGANRDLTMTNLEFREAHDLEWPTQLTVGYAEDTEIELTVVGDELVVYHDYCLGFEEPVTSYLKKRGAGVVDGKYNQEPLLSLLAASESEELIGALEAHFSYDGVENAPIVTSFRTRSSAGFFAPLETDRWPELERLLSSAPNEARYSLAVSRLSDQMRFESVASATCRECENPEVDFLPRELFAVPSDQLTCLNCGGMFDLEAVADIDE